MTDQNTTDKRGLQTDEDSASQISFLNMASHTDELATANVDMSIKLA